jgi:hypothetical protein
MYTRVTDGLVAPPRHRIAKAEADDMPPKEKEAV